MHEVLNGVPGEMFLNVILAFGSSVKVAALWEQHNLISECMNVFLTTQVWILIKLFVHFPIICGPKMCIIMNNYCTFYISSIWELIELPFRPINTQSHIPE